MKCQKLSVMGGRPEFLMGFNVPATAEAPVSVDRIGTRTAARCMGKSEQFVRVGLQRGLLPFGNAVPGTGVDSAKLKKKYPDIFKECSKTSAKAGYVKITLKDGEKG